MDAAEINERVEREEREWHEARLHAALHGTWDRDECPTCDLPDRPTMVGQEGAELNREGDPAFNGAFNRW